MTGLLVALGLRLAAIAVQPIAAVYRSNRDIQALEREYTAARQRNEWLQNRAHYLNTSAGIEEEARRLGWVRGGEVQLRVVTLPPSSPAGGSPTLSAAAGVSVPTAVATAQGSGFRAQVGPDIHAARSEPRALSQGTRPANGPTGRAPSRASDRWRRGCPPYATGPRGWGEPPDAVRPRSATAERIEQFLATWGPTRWIGELLK